MVLFWGAAREGGGKEEERREGWGGGRLSSPSSLPRGWELPGKGAEGNGGAEEPGVSTQVGTGWGWRPGPLLKALAAALWSWAWQQGGAGCAAGVQHPPVGTDLGR